MNASIIKALITKFDSDQAAGSAYALVGGEFYNTRAPASATLPYIVFTMVLPDHSVILGGPKDFDTVRFQFNVFDDDLESSVSIEAIALKLRALFDETTLSFAGTSNDYTSVKLSRDTEGLDRIEEVWDWRMDYLLTVQEA